jgi:hypothetical protein
MGLTFLYQNSQISEKDKEAINLHRVQDDRFDHWVPSFSTFVAWICKSGQVGLPGMDPAANSSVLSKHHSKISLSFCLSLFGEGERERERNKKKKTKKEQNGWKAE